MRFEAEMGYPMYGEADEHEPFGVERIRDLAFPVLVARFEDVSEGEAEKRRDEINHELRSRGWPELGDLRAATPASLIDAILDGAHDEDLDLIGEAVKERRKQQASKVRFSLRKGDRIKVVGDLRPRYLIGLTGVVVRVNQTTVTMDFDDPQAARRYSNGVRMPLEYVEAA